MNVAPQHAASQRDAAAAVIAFATLLQLLRAFLSGESPRSVATEPTQIRIAEADAQPLIALTAAHRVLPLLHGVFTKGVVDQVPSALRAAAWVAYETNRANNVAAERELVRLVSRLAHAGISMVGHKGPTLTRWLYRDASLRAYSDLDLLVPRASVFAAVEALAGLGYRSVATIHPNDRDAFLRAGRQYDIELTHVEGGRLVELHWRSDAQHALEQIDNPQWLATLPCIDIDGQEVRHLPAPELLFALLIHGTKHQWDRLSWLVDIALLLPRITATDWQYLVRAAQLQRCETRFLIGLLLAKNLFATPTGEIELFSSRARARATAIAQRIERELVVAPTSTKPVALIRAIIGDMRCNDSWRQSLAQGTRIAFTPNLRDWHHVGDYSGGFWGQWSRRLRNFALRMRKPYVRRG